jgi:peptidoglycan/LPS O-acetylase OafA/YrhL
VEWHIYFLVPALVYLWRRFGAVVTVLGALIVGYALRFGFEDTRLTRAHPQFIGMFALGMLAAYVARSREPRFIRLREAVPWSGLSGLGFSITVGLALYWGIGWSEARFHLLDVPVGIMTMAALAATANQSSLLWRFFCWPPLVALGAFSYSFYLIHAPLLQVIWQYGLVPFGLSHEAMLGCLLTLGFVVVALASYGFFSLFEAPFMRSPSAVAVAEQKPATGVAS